MLWHATEVHKHNVGVAQPFTIRHNNKGNGNDLVLLNSYETVDFLCDSHYILVNDRPKHIKSHLQAMPYELVQAAALKVLKFAL